VCEYRSLSVPMSDSFISSSSRVVVRQPMVSPRLSGTQQLGNNFGTMRDSLNKISASLLIDLDPSIASIGFVNQAILTDYLGKIVDLKLVKITCTKCMPIQIPPNNSLQTAIQVDLYSTIPGQVEKTLDILRATLRDPQSGISNFIRNLKSNPENRTEQNYLKADLSYLKDSPSLVQSRLIGPSSSSYQQQQYQQPQPQQHQQPSLSSSPSKISYSPRVYSPKSSAELFWTQLRSPSEDTLVKIVLVLTDYAAQILGLKEDCVYTAATANVHSSSGIGEETNVYFTRNPNLAILSEFIIADMNARLPSTQASLIDFLSSVNFKMGTQKSVTWQQPSVLFLSHGFSGDSAIVEDNYKNLIPVTESEKLGNLSRLVKSVVPQNLRSNILSVKSSSSSTDKQRIPISFIRFLLGNVESSIESVWDIYAQSLKSEVLETFTSRYKSSIMSQPAKEKVLMKTDLVNDLISTYKHKMSLSRNCEEDVLSIRSQLLGIADSLETPVNAEDYQKLLKTACDQVKAYLVLEAVKPETCFEVFNEVKGVYRGLLREQKLPPRPGQTLLLAWMRSDLVNYVESLPRKVVGNVVEEEKTEISPKKQVKKGAKGTGASTTTKHNKKSIFNCCFKN
jgi:hypothetical protein